MKKQPSMILTDYRLHWPDEERPFRVSRIRNSTFYTIGASLDLKTVNALIKEGWHITLKPPLGKES